MDLKELILASLDIMRTGKGCWPIDSVCKKANNGADVDDYLLEEVIDFLIKNDLVEMCYDQNKDLNRYSLMLKSKGNKFTHEQYEEIINPKKEALASPVFNIGTVEQFAYSHSGEISQVKIENNTTKKRTSLVQKIWFIISENALISSIVSFFICAIAFAFIKSKYPFFPYF